MVQPDTATLRHYSLFGGLLEADLLAVHALMQIEEHGPGIAVVTEGERGDRIYFISAGSVDVRKRRPAGDSHVTLATLVTGDAFGEMELVDLQPRSSTVVTRESCTLLTIAVRDLLHLQRERPQVVTVLMMNLARDLSRRLRKMDDRVAAGLG